MTYSRWATQYLGIPYLDRGMTRKGCDCWGLIRLIHAEQTGIELPSYPEIGKGDNLAKVRTIIAASESEDWLEIAPGQEQPFDVVLMRGQVRHDGRLRSAEIHVGCVVTPGTLIQIEEGCEVTITEYRTHPRVKHRIAGFYRYTEMGIE